MSSNSLDSKLKKESEDIFLMLEKQFLNLKFKASRCAKKCFETKEFPDVFACESKCMRSIKTVSDKMTYQQLGIEKKLQACIQEVNDATEGINSQVSIAFEGPAHCYERHLENLKALKEEMTTEFNYFI